jgi:hypothetical protein
VLFNVLTALLAGCECERFRALERCAHSGNPKRETFQQFRAQPGVFAANLQPNLNELVEKRL